MKPKFKLDIHGHILPAQWVSLKSKFGYGGFIEMVPQADGSANMMRDDGTFFRKVQKNCFDPSAILEDMNKFKVNIMVLSTVPVLFNYWAKPEHCLEWCVFLNDHIAEVQAQNPKRFISLGTLPMQSPTFAIKEMERCVKQLGLKGIEIGSNINQMNLDDQSLYPFWEAAQDMQVPIMVHPWQMMGEDQMKKYFMPWLVGMPAETTRAVCSMIFGGIFDKFPKLKIMFTHGGGSFIFTLGRIDHGFECRPDLCQINISKKPSEYLKNFWIDSITHNEAALKYLVDHMGHERIAYGTDYPFPLGDLEHGAMLADAQSLNETQKEHIFWKTAFKFFNLQPAEYMTSFS